MEQKSKALEFIYQDTEIHFLLGNEKNVMVNATEMAKAFGKEIDNFLRLENTKKFIISFLKRENSKIIPSDVRGYLTEGDIIIGKKRGGTYMHRKVALKFAAWLDVDFELWIIDTIDDLLFGKAKEVGNKISDAELKKVQIAELIQKVRDSGDVTAISLLDNLEELKIIEKEKKKAMAQFSNQFKMDF